MSNFINDSLNQTVFFDINYLDVLGENTFEYSLYYLLENNLDLGEFFKRYNNQRVGRKAYHPALLLRVIFYAYYRGITSSRVIEGLCKTDMKFIALAAGRTPHFTTIADFVSSNCEAMGKLFHQLLLVCDSSGLIGKEHFAIDGCKISSDASKEWSGTHKPLRKKSEKMKAAAQKIIDRHMANDVDKNNPNHSGELQTIDTLVRNANKIDAFLSENEPRIGNGKNRAEVQSNVVDNESANMLTSKGGTQGYVCVTAADDKHQIIVHAEAFGMGQEQATLKPMVEGIRDNLGSSIFSPTLKLTADTGFSSELNMEYVFSEGINAYIPDNQFRKRNPIFSESETYNKQKEKRKKTRKDKPSRGAVISSKEFSVNIEGKNCVCPNGKEMTYLGDHFIHQGGKYMRFRGKLKDCRACPLQARCMKKPLKLQGRQVSFMLEANESISYLDLMKQKIDSEDGRRIYSKRMWTIEPVFGNITSNKRLNRIGLRGQTKATSQWLMYCMVHNMEKLWKYGVA